MLLKNLELTEDYCENSSLTKNNLGIFYLGVICGFVTMLRRMSENSVFDFD